MGKGSSTEAQPREDGWKKGVMMIMFCGKVKSESGKVKTESGKLIAK